MSRAPAIVHAAWSVVLLLACAPACAVDLESAATSTTSPPPTLSSCLPLTGVVDGLTGRLDSVALTDGRTLLLGGGVTKGNASGAAGFIVGNATFCLSQVTPLGDAPLLDVSTLAPQLGVVAAQPRAALTTDATYLFFSAVQANGDDGGGGVARWDAATERFVAVSLLWTADRPSYGRGAVVDSGWVYVFGGLPARFLAADVYVARVPVAAIDTFDAYEYWQGSGRFASDPDAAAPLVEGGVAPSVAFSAAHNRWLMAYTTPLSTDITARVGLGPAGPWSLPVVVGRCQLPTVDPDAFCVDAVLHPALSVTDLALSFGVASFSRPASATVIDDWSRFTTLPWPPRW